MKAGIKQILETHMNIKNNHTQFRLFEPQSYVEQEFAKIYRYN